MLIRRLIANRSGEIWSCQADDSVADAIDVLASRRIGALPVRDAGQDVTGVFSERDVLYCLQKHGAEALRFKVRDMMTSPAITIPADTPVDDALALMTERRIRHLPVMDGGRMIGFISIGDLVKHRVESIQAEAEAMRSYIQTA
jgi:CBS domain-containing protein